MVRRSFRAQPVKALLLACLLLAGCGGGGDTEPRRPIVFIGDSITSRWDVAAHFPGLDTVNLGIGGDRSSMMLARFRDALDYEPRVLVINAGTNDVMLDRAADGVAHVRQMVARSTADRTIVLGTTSTNDDRQDTEELRAAMRQFDDDLAAMCRELRCVHIDLHTPSVMPDGSLNPALVVDFIHPNQAFYKLIADLVRPHLQ